MSESAPPAASAGGGGAAAPAGRSPWDRSRRAKNRRYRANLKTRSRLQIACWNAQGLRRKLTELQGWLSESNIDVIAVQEAQFSASSLTEIPGFQTAAVRRRARGRRNSGPAKGGDVAIYVRNGLNFDKLETSALKSSSPAPTLDIHNFLSSGTWRGRPEVQLLRPVGPPYQPRLPTVEGLECPPPGLGPALYGGGRDGAASGGLDGTNRCHHPQRRLPH